MAVKVPTSSEWVEQVDNGCPRVYASVGALGAGYTFMLTGTVGKLVAEQFRRNRTKRPKAW